MGRWCFPWWFSRFCLRRGILDWWRRGKRKPQPRVLKLRSFVVIPLGFEPRTHSLEGCCSIQLSYRTIFFKSVAKVRQFIENSNNLPKFFIRKLRQNLSNSLKWAIYEHLTSIEVMIWQQSQFLQHADVCCQTALLCCKVTIAARNNNRLLE